MDMTEVRLDKMNVRFAALVDSLHPSFLKLMSMVPATGGTIPRQPPISGIYLFSEAGKHLYVGRSNGIQKRYVNHCSISSGHNTAAFAMILARAETGRKRSYIKGPETRQSLMADATFKQVFDEQKRRIRAMEFRYVEESDPLKQTLLEVYCAVALSTPHNDFDNH
jgi:predicted GIY-YIG superfamily endonuclease